MLFDVDSHSMEKIQLNDVTKKKKRFINATPLSRQAKYRFITEMDSFHACTIQEENEKMYLLSSLNGQYYFWVEKTGNLHWKLEK